MTMDKNVPHISDSTTGLNYEDLSVGGTQPPDQPVPNDAKMIHEVDDNLERERDTAQAHVKALVEALEHFLEGDEYHTDCSREDKCEVNQAFDAIAAVLASKPLPVAHKLIPEAEDQEPHTPDDSAH